MHNQRGERGCREPLVHSDAAGMRLHGDEKDNKDDDIYCQFYFGLIFCLALRFYHFFSLNDPHCSEEAESLGEERVNNV